MLAHELRELEGADSRLEKFLLVMPPDGGEVEAEETPVTVMVNFVQRIRKK